MVFFIDNLMTSTSVSILSCNGIDSCAVIALCSDTENFLFDCGEGTQRLCVEKKFRLSKLSKVFLTRVEPETTGGLPGLILTASDSGRKHLVLHGPVSIHSYWGCIQQFCQRPNLQIEVDEISTIQTESGLTYKGDSVTVEPIISTNLPTHVSYVCQTRQLPGKFNVSKAVGLGVPKGPLFAQLKSGASITLPNGVIVKSNDVLETAELPGRVAIVCNLDRIDTLLLNQHLKHSTWNRFRASDSSEKQASIQCMFHLSPRAVVESAEYSSWIKSFDTDIKHVICGAGHDTRNSRSPFIAATLTNYKLCTVCPELFSDVFSSQTWFNSHITGSDHLEEDTPSTDAIMQIGCSSLQLKILPMSQRGFSLSQHGVLKLKDKISEFRALLTADPSLSRSANCRKNYVSDDCVDDTKADSRQNRAQTRALNVFGDNRIMFLGTGCAMPSKYRNVSGIALHLSHKADNSCAGILRQNSIVLLDVGEGSWYQLMRLACNDPSVFLSDKNHHLDSGLKIKLVQYTVARELAVAWISHPHADHFLGLITLIVSRHRILTESAVELDDDISSEQQSDVLCQPLLVIAPISVLYFLHSFTTHILPTMKSMYTAVACNHFDPDKISNSVELVEDALINDNPTSYRNVFSSLMKESMKNLPFASQVFVSLGISRFENINVVHCSQAFGLALTLQASAVTSSSSIVDTRDEPVANIEPDLKKCKVTEIEENHAFKIVYSGDTRPCSRLAQLGLNASLLIHEATFDDLKQEEAIKKRHSTITEALEVARDMNAHRTILTHFSQRYPNTPPVLADPTLPAPIFASDFMNIAFRDLSWAPNTTAAMTRIFPADADEDEDEVENISKEQNPPLDTVSFVTVASVDQYNGRSSNSKESESQAKSKNKTGSSTIFIPNKTPKASGFLSAFCDCEQDLCNHRINN